jgi:hypothetical protein
MMQKRNFYSLLLISFIAVLLVSSAFADSVTFETKAISRNVNQTATVTANVTTANVSAIEIVVEISGDYTLPAAGSRFTFDAGFTALTTRVIDDTSGVHGVGPDTIRIAAMLTTPSDAPLAAGTYVIGTINYKSNDVCTGAISLKPAVFTYPIPATVQTQFVDAATSTILPVAVTNGTITINNFAPTLAAISSATLFWGATFTATAVGSDADLANSPTEALTYSKVTGPAAMTVGATSGLISWTTTGADVGIHAVTIAVTDHCGAVAQVSFTICVQNKPPVITCPANSQVVLGDVASGTITSTDPDGGPAAPLYSLISFTGPGVFTVNPVTGVYSWPTAFNNAAYLGTWTATVKVVDGANLDACNTANADTCSFTVTVVWGKLMVEKVEGQLQGHNTTVNLYLGTNYPIGGFDLQLAYDQSAISLTSVAPGKFISDCAWEYFTYRFGSNGNCTGACPSGIVKIVGLAETNNGNHHPKCFTNYPPPVGTDSVIAVLNFFVSNNRNYDCQYVPIEFYWLDCTDNALSNVKGDSLLISRYVYGYGGAGSLYYRIDSLTAGFPTKLGAQAACDTHNKPGKPDTWRAIDFYNGGIDLICSESIDARGDINLNSIGYEVADAVMFTNYFISGLNAFGTHIEGSIAASDVNADGVTLTVADLVYLIRVVVGDALAYPKNTTRTASTQVVSVTSDNGILSTPSGIALGGAYIKVNGKVTPTLLATNMDMNFGFDGQYTNIIVTPSLKDHSTGFSGQFINVNGEVASMQLATLTGEQVAAKLAPKSFALNQNYPNPFNPTTTIEFALPTTSNYTLAIYNVQGQVVKTFEGSSEAGYVKVDWNASSVASGVYFYKLTAGSYTATKKMVLLK